MNYSVLFMIFLCIFQIDVQNDILVSKNKDIILHIMKPILFLNAAQIVKTKKYIFS